jgi:hypothetical protein
MSAVLYDLAFDYLQGKEYDVYPPSTKRGECSGNYIVLKKDESSQYGELSTVQENYIMYCYSKTYSGILNFVDSVRESMVGFVPYFFPSGVESPPIYDENVKAFMISMHYIAKRRDKYVKNNVALKSYNYQYHGVGN